MMSKQRVFDVINFYPDLDYIRVGFVSEDGVRPLGAIKIFSTAHRLKKDSLVVREEGFCEDYVIGMSSTSVVGSFCTTHQLALYDRLELEDPSDVPNLSLRGQVVYVKLVEYFQGSMRVEKLLIKPDRKDLIVEFTVKRDEA